MPEVSAALNENKHYCVLCSSWFQQDKLIYIQCKWYLYDRYLGGEEFGLRLPSPLSSKFFQCRPFLVPTRQRPSEISGGLLLLWGLDVLLLQHWYNWVDMPTAHHGALDDMANTPWLTQSWHTWGAENNSSIQCSGGIYMLIITYTVLTCLDAAKQYHIVMGVDL